MDEGNGVELREMSAERYEAYLELAIPDYADEGAKATGMAREEALAVARRQFAALLPDGRKTSGQFLRDVVDGSGRIAGLVWYAFEPRHEPPRVFLYDIRIDEDRRGEGLGTAAMLRVEAAGRELGAAEVALHVFFHNEGAVRLYERLGYTPSDRGPGSMRMAKPLAR